MMTAPAEAKPEFLRALPGDEIRQILWRFADRFDLQMLVQSVRAVARGPVARLVAGLLVGVAPTDLPAFAGTAVFLCAIAFLATYIPALRATNIQPMVALRCEQ